MVIDRGRTAWLVVGWVLLAAALAQAAKPDDRIVLKNDAILRELAFDGRVWRTVRFARADGSDGLAVQSDELQALRMDGTAISLDAYLGDGEPIPAKTTTQESLTIRYKLRVGADQPGNTPGAVTISYTLAPGSVPYVRKTVTLHMQKGEVIDRLEVERFSTTAPASRGGRGEPVFVNNTWFFGVEYPAFYSRHTDGNTPTAYSGPYDKLGNYSFIDLDKHDIDKQPRDGLIRLMHFPGYAKPREDGYGIVSKTAVAGVGKRGDSIELAFLDYLDTIRRPVRSFIHYNNWYDAEGKKLTIDNFVAGTFGAFKKHLDPYGVRIDAMVPDDGWQDRKSIYQPNPAQFPRGMDDVAALGDALEKAGTHLGLWIALNGYNSDIDWGKANGYAEAERNPYFSKFKRYYALAEPKHDAAIRERVTDLIQRGHVQYFKHDFNEMCDTADRPTHPGTDRHGHEASVDAELGILALERKLNPDIYQNITNWVWFSPWWLQHGNNLWMLSNDSGEFNGWPELSLLVRATAYRDVNLYRVWHDPATRPLVPISHLMTHGIIYTKSKYAPGAPGVATGAAGDTPRDFADYVMMYYMRGLQLKEWYINPKILSDEQWQVLGRATRWSEENQQTLANAVFVGGDPAKGQAYGYICWRGEHGILSVRNPSPGEAETALPFDQSVWYRGPSGKEFRGRVVYPYQGDLGVTFRSGQPMKLTVPGYTVMVMHLEPGAAGVTSAASQPIHTTRVIDDRNEKAWIKQVNIPDEAMQRCELILIAKKGGGKPTLPGITLDGHALVPERKATGTGWEMGGFDLRRSRGKSIELVIERGTADDVEAWLLLDRPITASPADNDPRLPMPVAQGYQRQTAPVLLLPK